MNSFGLLIYLALSVIRNMDLVNYVRKYASEQ